MPMGEPGWPEFAACTASMHRVRIVLIACFSMGARSLATVRPVVKDMLLLLLVRSALRCLTRLAVLGFLDPDQRHLLGLVLAEVDEHGRLVLRQVGDAGIEYRRLAAADGPGDALGLL